MSAQVTWTEFADFSACLMKLEESQQILLRDLKCCHCQQAGSTSFTKPNFVAAINRQN